MFILFNFAILVHVYPLQCSCLENPRDGGAWWAAVHGVAQSWTRLKRLSSSSNACVVALDYGLVLHFSNHQWFSVSYLVLFSTSISSLVKFLLSFFFFACFLIGLFVSLFSLKRSLYIWNASPLLDICFTNIFYQSIDYLFIFFTVFLKLLNFDEFNLLIFL